MAKSLVFKTALIVAFFGSNISAKKVAPPEPGELMDMAGVLADKDSLWIVAFYGIDFSCFNLSIAILTPLLRCGLDFNFLTWYIWLHPPPTPRILFFM